MENKNRENTRVDDFGVIYNEDWRVLIKCENENLNHYVVVQGCEVIGFGAFCACSELKHISIPASVQRIDDQAFMGCYKLEDIQFSNSIEEIGDHAFERCLGLRHLCIPNSIKTIGKSAFEDCVNLCSVEIPDSVYYIDSFAFCECEKLKSVVLPDSIGAVGGQLFYDCSELKNVKLSNSLEGIPWGMFDGCKRLESIEIPHSVEFIEDHAFRGCESLVSIELPESVKTVGVEVFEGCISLQQVRYPNRLSVYAFNGTPYYENLQHALNLYKILQANEYYTHPYELEDLGEGMAVVYQVIYGWRKPRYLVNHNTKCAYEFMNKDQRLVTVTGDDIDWESLKNLPEDAVGRARALSFHFPSFIRHFENGVAEVSWQINPDGRYYMDEDGYGMTDDEEIEIYGFIDQNAKVVVKFKNINECYGELDKMRKEAEEIIKSRK